MALDDPQRNLIGGAAIALGIGGPVVWVTTVLATTRWPWPAVVFPPIAMWALGCVLFIWAWGKPDTWGSRRRSAIREGHTLSHLPRQPATFERLFKWQKDTYLWLAAEAKDHVADEWNQLAVGNDPLAWVPGLLDYLKQLSRWRHKRWRS